MLLETEVIPMRLAPVLGATIQGKDYQVGQNIDCYNRLTPCYRC